MPFENFKATVNATAIMHNGDVMLFDVNIDAPCIDQQTVITRVTEHLKRHRNDKGELVELSPQEFQKFQSKIESVRIDSILPYV